MCAHFSFKFSPAEAFSEDLLCDLVTHGRYFSEPDTYYYLFAGWEFPQDGPYKHLNETEILA